MSNRREELLQKWAELAPGECEVMHDSIRFPRIVDGWYFYRPRVQPVVDAILLSALIEAIRAREGWHAMMQIGISAEGVTAAVWADRQRLVATESESCDALLSAYVQALDRGIKR